MLAIVLTAAAAAVVPLVTLLAGALASAPGFGNDFSSYWLAGRLVADGRSPYDLNALSTLAEHEHVVFLLGGGYSYPPPLAVLMVPASALPFRAALLAFDAVSILVFAVAAGAWAVRLSRMLRDERAAADRIALPLAFAAGAYPPVIGSVYFGQANLLVVGLLAFGCWPLLGGRLGEGRQMALSDARLGITAGLTGVVKLVPLVLVIPLVLWRRWLAVAALVVSAVATLAGAAVLAPVATRDSGRLSALFGADGFWSNQSLNGFATRLVASTDRTSPLLPAADVAAAIGTVLIAALAVATLAVLWRARPRGSATGLDRNGGVDVSGLGLAIALSLVAAVAGAPKDSFWNHVPALIAVGLLLASLASMPRSRFQRLHVPSARLVVLAAWYGGAWIQLGLDATQGAATRFVGPAGAILSSTALLGLLALWGLLAYENLLRPVISQTLTEGALAPYSGT